MRIRSPRHQTRQLHFLSSNACYDIGHDVGGCDNAQSILLITISWLQLLNPGQERSFFLQSGLAARGRRIWPACGQGHGA